MPRNGPSVTPIRAHGGRLLQGRWTRTGGSSNMECGHRRWVRVLGHDVRMKVEAGVGVGESGCHWMAVEPIAQERTMTSEIRALMVAAGAAAAVVCGGVASAQVVQSSGPDVI